MDQVSRPMLIALAATVVLAALWLVALRPKTTDVADTPAAPVTAIGQAKDAAATSDAANDKLANATDGAGSAATPGATTTPATPASPAKTAAIVAAKATAKSAAAAVAVTGRREEAAVVRDIRRGKVVVLLFWNARSSDDRATRAAVRGLSRHGGKVAVHVVPISRVGRFESITRGVTVNQSPVTLVIDRKRRTRAIIGLSERGELTQAVDDALARQR
jgi:hypothetical protein